MDEILTNNKWWKIEVEAGVMCNILSTNLGYKTMILFAWTMQSLEVYVRLSEKYNLKKTCHIYVEFSVVMFLEMVGQISNHTCFILEILVFSYYEEDVRWSFQVFFLLKLTTDIVLLLRNEFANACHVLVDDPHYGLF